MPLAILAAALMGAFGTAGAALAAHGRGGETLAIAAAVLFVHAPALLALGLAGPARLRFAAVPALGLTLGVALFSGDLAARALAGAERLFPNAAPAGGMILIASWLLLGVLALLPPRAPPG